MYCPRLVVSSSFSRTFALSVNHYTLFLQVLSSKMKFSTAFVTIALYDSTSPQYLINFH